MSVPQNLTFLGLSENRIKVYYDAHGSHAATHFANTPGLQELVKEVISMTVTTGGYMWFETDMGREVGMSDLVETDETDDILYAKRLGRTTYTRFTKSRPAVP